MRSAVLGRRNLEPTPEHARQVLVPQLLQCMRIPAVAAPARRRRTPRATEVEKQFLEDEIKYASAYLDEAKKTSCANEKKKKATAEGDLAVTTKALNGITASSCTCVVSSSWMIAIS